MRAENSIHRRSQRHGFTLIELLVAITIFLLLTAATVASFNFAFNGDKVRSAARQFQSFVMGARDRGIYAKEIRGVRLLIDPNDNHAVNGMIYLGSPQRETGTLTVDQSGYFVTQATGSTGIEWLSLYRRGLLGPGARIQIPANTGCWYTITTIDTTTASMTINPRHADLGTVNMAAANIATGFVLELLPAVLGDAQPVLFPSGIVIDLDGSEIPDLWRPNSFAGGSYLPQMDILFNPRGAITGDTLTKGMLHFHFADASEVFKWHSIGGRITHSADNPTGFSVLPFVPVDDATAVAGAKPVVGRDRILATIATRTGNVGVYQVNIANSNITQQTVGSNTPPTIVEHQKRADDPYLFAETGQVANK